MATAMPAYRPAYRRGPATASYLYELLGAVSLSANRVPPYMLYRARKKAPDPALLPGRPVC